ncbi:hypothetical protein HDU87_004671 [Geranomyces variabilis]|uniref:Sulfate transporter n=1 Tax=Geranomyces variabilis TaxID=109894 RepID=A0AAD5TJC2_9FUNG|nr:hypothetical protein HDU87_004671 [Geranomyces variabilis]
MSLPSQHPATGCHPEDNDAEDDSGNWSHPSSASSAAIPVPSKPPNQAVLTAEPVATSSTSSFTPRSNPFALKRRSSKLQPTARSYFSTRSEDSSTLLDESALAQSAAQTRQQTLSWTYRELQLASNTAPSEAAPAPTTTQRHRMSGRVAAASPLRESDDSVTAGAGDDTTVTDTTIVSPSKERPRSPGIKAFDPLAKEKRADFERKRQVSQLSALRQLALSVEQEDGADDLEIAQENAFNSHETTPLLLSHHHSGGSELDIPDVTAFGSAAYVEEGGFNKPLQRPRRAGAGGGGGGTFPASPNSATGASRSRPSRVLHEWTTNAKNFKPRDVVNYAGFVIATMPAVLLALILNVLDAMSYGIIIFPAELAFIPETAVTSGISMFLASTVISQLVYTLGGSAFTGAVGSMMIEVMPFLHIICRTIHSGMHGAAPHAILATVMVAYAMSTLLTGLVFLLLGIFKLGTLVQFFPRHILVGCIGGIGLFLIFTGVEVTSGITTAYTLEYLRAIFKLAELKLWGSSLGLAIFLKMLQRRIQHPLFVPLFYVCVPILFYLVVFIGRFSLEEVRNAGWLISLPEGPPAPFYEFWTYYDFTAIDWGAIPATIPTQLALTFFGILHVPINVPALAVSTHQDVNLNRELIGHGISNLASGFFGSISNYMVYSNSLLYIRSGGDSKTGGLLLALATALVWMAGGKVIGFVPTIVVGSLIFHLGIDLLKESVWDTWNTGIHTLEYATIISIVTVMGVVGFTEGILTGVILACVFFVVMYARRSVIRATYTGSQLRSTVHRLYRQQYFLDQVGDQIHIIKLQGFMFFGTINQLDAYIADTLTADSRIRYVVLDFSLIYGIDYSALESFHRIKRMMRERRIHLVFAGLSVVGRTLAQSGIFEEEDEEEEDDVQLTAGKLPSSGLTPKEEQLVHAFEDVNQSLEWCENQLLVTYYQKMAGRQGPPQPPPVAAAARPVPAAHEAAALTGLSLGGLTPRRREIDQAASLVLADAPAPPLPPATASTTTPKRTSSSSGTCTESFLPVALLLQAFSEPGDYDPELLHFCEGKFERVEVKKGSVLWVAGEDPNELYVVHDGELVLVIKDNDPRGKPGAMKVVETLLPGTMVGELELFSNRPRACRLVAASDAVVWRLTKASCDELAEQDPKLMLRFVTKIALGFDAVRFYNYLVHFKY